MGLTRFNDMPAEQARHELHACCASRAWQAAMVAGRPYADLAGVITASTAAIMALDWVGVREAVDAHPRIGDRVAGADQESAWSRREQSGMDTATAEVRRALVEANRAYEERFDHVFLIFASGRTDTEMLAAARERVRNDEDTERAIVRDQLTRIVNLRLSTLFTDGPEAA